MKHVTGFLSLILILLFVLCGCDSIGNEDNPGNGDTSYWFEKQGAPGTLTITPPPRRRWFFYRGGDRQKRLL